MLELLFENSFQTCTTLFLKILKYLPINGNYYNYVSVEPES